MANGGGGVIIVELGVEVLHLFYVDAVCSLELEFMHGGGGAGRHY